MFEQQQLDHLLDLHDRSFRVLQWLNKGLKHKKLQISTVHDAISLVDATKDWLKHQQNNLPPSIRPKEDEIDEFSYLLASYLQTSFEIKKGLASASCPGCWCLMCLYVWDATFLQARKVTDGARASAQKLKVLFLGELASDLGLPLVQTDFEPFIKNNPDLSEAISLLTYTRELMRRTNFGSQGPAVLALWREIAWTATSPKKNFKLTTDLILQAQTEVSSRLRELCNVVLE